MKRVLALAVVATVATGCGARTVRPARAARAAPTADANVFVYLERLSANVGGLSVALETIEAVDPSGGSHPLEFRFRRLETTARSGERLLALGVVPPGEYTGLRVRASEAILRGEEGPVALRIEEPPGTIPLAFRVRGRAAVVISARFEAGRSIEDGFRFRPAFTAEIPSDLAPGLLGIASSPSADAITLFDKISGQVVGIVRAGRAPAGLAIDRERQRLYVALSDDDAVAVVDLLGFAVIDRLRLTPDDRPTDIALTPDGDTLLVANYGSATVSVVDAVGLFERDRVRVGDGPRGVLVDRDGRRAFVLNSESSTITVLGLPTAAPVTTIATEAGPFRASFDDDGRLLYVIHRSSPYLTVVDVDTLESGRRTYVGPGMTAVRTDPRTDRILVARRGLDVIEVFDPISLLPSEQIPVDANVGYIGLDFEGNNVALLLPDPGEIRLVRLVRFEVAARIDVVGAPYEVAFYEEP